MDLSLSIFIILITIKLMKCDPIPLEKSKMIDRQNQEVAKQLLDLNKKLEASETTLLNLLNHQVIKDSNNLQEHVEKLLDYLRFRKDGINNWNISQNQFKKMTTRINKDYIALPYKIVNILSYTSRNKLVPIVPST